MSASDAARSLADDGGLQRLFLAVHERWGRLDLVVHCAAHATPPPATSNSNNNTEETSSGN